MKKYTFLIILFFILILSPRNLFSFIIEDDIFNYSKVIDSNINNNSNQTVIWIQDLHNDYNTQNNIYKTLSILSKNADIEKIYTEGVFNNEELNTSLLSTIPTNKIKNKAIDNLLKSGLLSASEYFSLKTNNKVYGIEDKQIYSQNIKLLNKINSNIELNSYITNKINIFVDNLKSKYILNKISEAQNININSITLTNNFPNLQKQQNIFNINKNINIKDLNLELTELLSKLKKDLPAKQYTKLYKYLEYNSNYGYAKFYNSTKDKLHNYPQLELFLKSNIDLFAINPMQLIEETDSIKKELLNDFSLNISETEIIDLQHYCNLIQNLVTTKISCKQYEQLKNNRNYVSYLLKKYLTPTLSKFALMYLNDTDFFTFYDNNLYRNKIFIENILNSSKPNKFKVIVAGGFHLGIIDELKKQNKSYIVLTPNATTSAFNQLFTAKFNYGTQQDISQVLFETIKQMSPFFYDIKAFQQEINKWISAIPTLKNCKIKIDLDNDIYKLVIQIDDYTEQFEFLYTNKASITSNKKVKHNKYIIKQAYTRIYEIAKSKKYFGNNTEIIINNDNSLINSSELLPIAVFNQDGVTKISINKKFLEAISVESDKTIETVVQLLFLCSSFNSNIEDFSNFLIEHKFEIQTIYSINRNLLTNQSFFEETKNYIKNFFNIKQISTYIGTNQQSLTQDERGMLEALKQAELARQNRNKLLTFIQPPVGGYIVDENGVEGRYFNDTESALHAETLTIINYFKNYIEKNKLLLSPYTYNLINTLLYDLVENGKHVNAKFFYNNPLIFKTLGIEMEYGKRTKDELFKETTLVLQYINNKLENPIKTCKLYCTLQPCNKCINTMCALKIDTLIYSSNHVNSTHTNFNLLNKNGIKTVSNVLREQSDKYIKRYSLLNSLSIGKIKFGTSIASFIQTCRDKAIKVSTIDYSALYDDFIKVVNPELKTIIDLQKNIDWNNITKSTDLKELTFFLERIKVLNDPIRRAGIIYVLRNNMKAYIEDGNIYFKNENGITLDLYINQDLEVVVSQQYLDQMKELAKTRNIADLDDNLAARDEAFRDDMANIFNNLLLYGIGDPIIVTGNTLEQTKDKRLLTLGKTTPRFIQKFYTVHGARLYESKDTLYATSENMFEESEDYLKNVSEAYMDDNLLSEIDFVMLPYKEAMYGLFDDFKVRFNTLNEQQLNNITYENIIAQYPNEYFDILLSILKSYPNYHIDSLKDLMNFWKIQTREKLSSILEPYLFEHIKLLNQNDAIQVFKAIAILEMSRIYFSQENDDKEEQRSLKKGLDKNVQIKFYDKHADITRYIISPMRPTFVKTLFVNYIKPTMERKFKGLEIVSAGQTTININKNHISKRIPIKHIIEQGHIDPRYVIYTGDDFGGPRGGVDLPVYKLTEELYPDIVVIATAHQKIEELDGKIPFLIDIKGFSNEETVDANIDRSVRLQSMILKMIENRIGNILANTNTEFDTTIAQELETTIMSEQVEVIDINEYKTKETEGVLKAG